jgi:hypothetical protein
MLDMLGRLVRIVVMHRTVVVMVMLDALVVGNLVLQACFNQRVQAAQLHGKTLQRQANQQKDAE